MEFIGADRIKNNKGEIISSNIQENLMIAAKSNKKLLRTALIAFLMLGLKGEGYAEIKNFFETEVNRVVQKYVEEYLGDVDFEYVKDLSISEFEYNLEDITMMDISYRKIHSIAIEEVNRYNNDELYLFLK